MTLAIFLAASALRFSSSSISLYGFTNKVQPVISMSCRAASHGQW